MHNQEGAAVYVNRYIAPAFFGQNDIRNEIDRLSAIFGDRAREFRMPRREGFPNAVIAIWGQLELNQIDPTESLTVASGGSLQKGILISFLDDLQRSAKLGVPVYRLAGGAGFLWSASFDQDGRGVLRFLAIDASLIAGASNAPLHVLPPIVQSPNGVEQRNAAPPPSGFTTEVPNAPSSSPGEKDQPIPKESVVQLAEKDLSAPTLESNQAIRDALFAKLKEGTTRYTFDYLTINLPPGTLPGINVSVPVSHIRYNETVFFAFDKYDLEPPAEAAVLEFARTILQDKSYRSILVVGHTDSIGTGEYNYSLSKKRAVTVAMALRAAGIPDQSLGVVPMGQSQPLTTNITAEGRALNRRVEFFISDVPGATKAAIEQIKFNPCYIISQQTTSGTNCSGGSKSIPILPSSGEGRPIALLDLTRSAIPSDPFVFRLPLPVEPLQRPSIDELQQEK
jgi:outer membrane protein OmpA-like peptidoglycan-associated protein